MNMYNAQKFNLNVHVRGGSREEKEIEMMASGEFLLQ